MTKFIIGLICAAAASSSFGVAGRPEDPNRPRATDSTATDDAVDLADPAALRALVAELGSAEWKVRRRAERLLPRAGRAAYEPLREALNATHKYDLRRRIKLVARNIYVQNDVETLGGFLGIRYDQTDAIGPRGEQGVRIIEVVHGSAASRAELRPGDIIRGVNGRPLRAGEPAFKDWIGGMPPHTEVELTVMRIKDAHRLTRLPVRRQHNNHEPPINEPAHWETIQVQVVLGVRGDLDQPASYSIHRSNLRFDRWWSRTFDPDGILDESMPVEKDPRWMLEPRGTMGAEDGSDSIDTESKPEDATPAKARPGSLLET